MDSKSDLDRLNQQFSAISLNQPPSLFKSIKIHFMPTQEEKQKANKEIDKRAAEEYVCDLNIERMVYFFKQMGIACFGRRSAIREIHFFIDMPDALAPGQTAKTVCLQQLFDNLLNAYVEKKWDTAIINQLIRQFKLYSEKLFDIKIATQDIYLETPQSIRATNQDNAEDNYEKLIKEAENRKKMVLRFTQKTVDKLEELVPESFCESFLRKDIDEEKERFNRTIEGTSESKDIGIGQLVKAIPPVLTLNESIEKMANLFAAVTSREVLAISAQANDCISSYQQNSHQEVCLKQFMENCQSNHQISLLIHERIKKEFSSNEHFIIALSALASINDNTYYSNNAVREQVTNVLKNTGIQPEWILQLGQIMRIDKDFHPEKMIKGLADSLMDTDERISQNNRIHFS